jgi:hypothetical protein
MRILRRPLMIFVTVVFSILETEGILGIELGANLAKGKISIVLGDMLI